jgi:tripartite-type tricarboxylate transporter receptor subunit TctC
MEKARAGSVALVFLLLAAFICVEALQVPFGGLRMPGAGFFPLLLGVTLGVFSLMLLGTSLLNPAAGLVVINKAAGSGAVGAQFVANSKPDGYTVLHGLNALTELPQVDELLGRKPAFWKEQFIPIGQVAVTPFAMMVNVESRWKTFQEFVAEAKQKPDEFQYASAGVYSTTHFMWEKILRATGIRVRHMPTTGGGPIMVAVLGKHVDIGHCVAPAVCAPQVEARKVRLLAITSESRLPIYPDVPTLKELGYDVTHSIWHTLMVPAGTPPDVVVKLRQGLKGMVEDEAFKSLMTKLGERIQYMSGENFEKYWDEEYRTMGTLLRQLIKK